MNTRFKDVRLSEGMSMKKFGDVLGISDSAVARIESGDRKVTDRVVRDICREFHVNETWLLTGEGEMHEPPSRQQEIAQLVAKLATLNMEDPSDQLLYDIEMWLGKLPKSVWDEFLVFMKEEIPKLNLK